MTVSRYVCHSYLIIFLHPSCHFPQNPRPIPTTQCVHPPKAVFFLQNLHPTHIIPSNGGFFTKIPNKWPGCHHPIFLHQIHPPMACRAAHHAVHRQGHGTVWWPWYPYRQWSQQVCDSTVYGTGESCQIRTNTAVKRHTRPFMYHCLWSTVGVNKSTISVLLYEVWRSWCETIPLSTLQ